MVLPMKRACPRRPRRPAELPRPACHKDCSQEAGDPPPRKPTKEPKTTKEPTKTKPVAVRWVTPSVTALLKQGGQTRG